VCAYDALLKIRKTNMTLDEIHVELERGDVLPGRAADLLVIVSAKYGRAADEYVKKSAEFAKVFNNIRKEYKSDTAAERFIENSELGIELNYWKYQLKKAEMISKALNTLVYLRTAEAKSYV
jgi:hypothetical protein